MQDIRSRKIKTPIKDDVSNDENSNRIYLKTSIREFVPFVLLIGSWVWFFSAQSSEIKLNSRMLNELSVVVDRVSATLTEQRIKASTNDEALRRIDASLLEIKSTLHNTNSVK